MHAIIALLRLIAAVGTLGLATACKTSQGDAPSNREIGVSTDGMGGGVSIGTTGGAPIGSRADRVLDSQERRRLRDAAQQAFAARTNVTTAYTIEPRNIDAEPTVVAATPAGPQEIRADGSACRLIKLAATKDGQTTTDTMTFCRGPGSSDPKPATN